MLVAVTRIDGCIDGCKGINVGLQAMAALQNGQRERLVYLVGGKGAAMAGLQMLARDLDIEQNDRRLGFVFDTDLPELYRAMDLSVLCTREQLGQRSVERFGMVFLEAQSCAWSAVGTCMGGIPDAIYTGSSDRLIADAVRKVLGSEQGWTTDAMRAYVLEKF